MKIAAKTECLPPPPSRTGLTPPLVSAVRERASAICFNQFDSRLVGQARLELTD